MRVVKVILCLFGVVLLGIPSIAEDRGYLLGTASPGGTYYPVGVALATLVNVSLQEQHGIHLTAVPTAGSAENVRLLREGEVQFAILQGLVASDASAGKGQFAGSPPDPSLRSLTALWPNVEQFVIRAEFAKTGTIDDLLTMKGQRIVLGEVDSGTLASSRMLIENLGVAIERANELVYMGYGPAADALQSGNVAAIALPAGVPTKALTRLKAAIGESAVLLAFSPDQAVRADGGRGLWKPYKIHAKAYPTQETAIFSIAQPNVLAVRADIVDEDAYRITRAIYENLTLLRSLHQATQEMALSNALSGLPLPLHPGARRYFEEQGLEIPPGVAGE